MHIRVTDKVLDAAAETRQLIDASSEGMGAIASFCGLMRANNEGQAVSAMTLEYYPGMTKKALQAIAEQAVERWNLGNVHVVHRHGDLEPSDPIVFVGCSSAHRADAFLACEFIMDYLKTEAPFWKKERTGKGETWVHARHSDDQAKQRWDTKA
ncbi:MAG: molybdenum cofactor biosynthesis protein MoaE [gamma proteobacterium symbiont of Bathyaustriella thionipta]|nr:molybdenum cofactor biosynthesis protein MoaE [gamma proteobacterium symbiont of Bathyaustriella thionipta]